MESLLGILVKKKKNASIADQAADENRARVVESGSLFGFVMDCLEHDALLPFAIATALNVCVDYSETTRRDSSCRQTGY